MTPDEFRRIGHEIVDLHRRLPRARRRTPGDGRDRAGRRQGAAARLAARRDPESFDAILRDLDHIIVPGLTHWQHPHFFGYFPCNGTLASVLGDYVSTGLGVLGLAWQSSPALTELEEVVTDWLRQMVGLSDGWQRRHPGHGLDQHADRAALRARAHHSATALSRGGLQSEATPLVVYASAHSHSSVDKAALLAGFGRDNVRHRAARRSTTRCGPTRSTQMICDDVDARPAAVRRRRDDRHDDDDGDRSGGGDRRDRAAARPVAARRRGDGRAPR